MSSLNNHCGQLRGPRCKPSSATAKKTRKRSRPFRLRLAARRGPEISRPKLSPADNARPEPIDRTGFAGGLYRISVDPADFYAKMLELGLNYGPQFQTIESLHYSQTEVLTRLRTNGDIRGFHDSTDAARRSPAFAGRRVAARRRWSSVLAGRHRLASGAFRRSKTKSGATPSGKKTKAKFARPTWSCSPKRDRSSRKSRICKFNRSALPHCVK